MLAYDQAFRADKASVGGELKTELQTPKPETRNFKMEIGNQSITENQRIFYTVCIVRSGKFGRRTDHRLP